MLKIKKLQLQMRPLEVTDVDFVMTWVNDREVVKNFQHFDQKFTRHDEKKYIKRTLENKGDYVFSFFNKQTGNYVGQGGIHQISWENKLGRLSVIIRRECWNKGYGREITSRLIHFAFNNLRLHKVWIIVYASNRKSLYLNQKIGFRKEGLLRDEYFWHGRYHDMVRMAIVNSRKPK